MTVLPCLILPCLLTLQRACKHGSLKINLQTPQTLSSLKELRKLAVYKCHGDYDYYLLAPGWTRGSDDLTTQNHYPNMVYISTMASPAFNELL